MDLDDLAPLLDTGSRIGVLVVTVVVSINLINRTVTNSQSSWQHAAATLTESAEWSKAETSRLRDRVAALEGEARQYAEDRADWLTERAKLMSRITHLETVVETLTTELATISHERDI